MYVRKNVYRMKHVHHVFFLNVTYQKSAPSIWKEFDTMYSPCTWKKITFAGWDDYNYNKNI